MFLLKSPQNNPNLWNVLYITTGKTQHCFWRKSTAPSSIQCGMSRFPAVQQLLLLCGFWTVLPQKWTWWFRSNCCLNTAILKENYINEGHSKVYENTFIEQTWKYVNLSVQFIKTHVHLPISVPLEWCSNTKNGTNTDGITTNPKITSLDQDIFLWKTILRYWVHKLRVFVHGL